MTIVLAASIQVVIATTGADMSTLDRPHDPVVLVGDRLPTLQGVPIEEIVAFRYSGTWDQIPVQIDERTWVDFNQVYSQPPIGLTVLAYADPATYTGADPDTILISMMNWSSSPVMRASRHRPPRNCRWAYALTRALLCN